MYLNDNIYIHPLHHTLKGTMYNNLTFMSSYTSVWSSDNILFQTGNCFLIQSETVLFVFNCRLVKTRSYKTTACQNLLLFLTSYFTYLLGKRL